MCLKMSANKFSSNLSFFLQLCVRVHNVTFDSRRFYAHAELFKLFSKTQQIPLLQVIKVILLTPQLLTRSVHNSNVVSSHIRTAADHSVALQEACAAGGRLS